MTFKLDVVITTYNRPEHVLRLVENILRIHDLVNQIIVVDSSELENTQLKNYLTVKTVRSERKCQPYQRYLGYLHSASDIICYFDDDIIIKDSNIFANIIEEYKKPEIAGVGVRIDYETSIKMNNSMGVIKNGGEGKISWLGRTTNLPLHDATVQYFPGPCMSFRRDVLEYVFDDYMFDMFEKRRGMGEDKAISMRASSHGVLMYLGNRIYIHHPPIASTYYLDDVSFIAKTIYSRLWLSRIYAQTHNRPVFFANSIFLVYYFKQLFSVRLCRIKGSLRALSWLLS